MDRHLLASALITAMVAGSLSAQPLSFRQRALTAGIGPTSVVAGDFNNDGKLDLAVGSSGGVSVSHQPMKKFVRCQSPCEIGSRGPIL